MCRLYEIDGWEESGRFGLEISFGWNRLRETSTNFPWRFQAVIAEDINQNGHCRGTRVDDADLRKRCNQRQDQFGSGRRRIRAIGERREVSAEPETLQA